MSSSDDRWTNDIGDLADLITRESYCPTLRRKLLTGWSTLRRIVMYRSRRDVWIDNFPRQRTSDLVEAK